jgi:hypothetical protein
MVPAAMMKFRIRKAHRVAVSLIAIGIGAAQAQAPQYDASYEPPRTPWGDPDLQGVWPATAMVGVPLERPAALGQRNWLTEAEYRNLVTRAEQQADFDVADFDRDDPNNLPVGQIGSPVSPPPHWLERGEPQYQAGLIVDPPNGQFPALVNPVVSGSSGSGRVDSYLDLSLVNRCITRGVAGSVLPALYNNGNEIFQAPGYVAIRNEMIHEVRIVPLDQRPHADVAVRMWMGDSRGHWEGNTLVIETGNLNGQTSISVGGREQTIDQNATLTERLSRVDDETILYSLTVDDPRTWVAPWTVQFPWKLENDYGMFEYACHEGNYALSNILSGARAEAAGSAAR